MKAKGREIRKGAGEGAAFAFVALLLIACAFAFSHSLESVKWYVDDKDPQSYAGIVLLMVAIQLIFFFAGGLKLQPDLKGAAAGVACFLLAAAVFVVLPQELSLNFWFFRCFVRLFAHPLFHGVMEFIKNIAPVSPRWGC